MTTDDGAHHGLPVRFGDRGVLARLLRALPASFAPDDVVAFVTPFGAAFEPLVLDLCERRGGRLSRHYTVAVGSAALAELARGLDGPARAGAVYVSVSRGDAMLLHCEDGYDWLWLAAALPPHVRDALLDQHSATAPASGGAVD